jgi:hypothetical protein
MKILVIFLCLVVAVLIGGFGFFAFSNPTIQQQDVSREIPAERLTAD